MSHNERFSYYRVFLILQGSPEATIRQAPPEERDSHLSLALSEYLTPQIGGFPAKEAKAMENNTPRVPAGTMADMSGVYFPYVRGYDGRL